VHSSCIHDHRTDPSNPPAPAGKELALAVLARGHMVMATSRAGSLPKLAELEERGASVLNLDVVAPLSQLQEVAKEAVGIYGKIDVVVNNGGMSLLEPWRRTRTFRHLWSRRRSLICGVYRPQESLDQFNTNLFGGLNVARAFLPYMHPRKTGTIVWIGSLAGYRWVNIMAYLLPEIEDRRCIKRRSRARLVQCVRTR